jgi:galactose oxidase
LRNHILTRVSFQVFHAGPSKQMHWITTAGNGTLKASVRRGDDTDAMNGSAVMYDIGKILTVGGAMNYDDGPASNRAYMIDINGPEASVRRTQYDMQFARSLVNSVVLPNGEVVIIGGMATVKLFSDLTAVLEAEIWSPLTDTFRTLKPMRVPRTYHAVALLLKDGRVWAAGMQSSRSVVIRERLLPVVRLFQVADFAAAVVRITGTSRY